MRNLPRRRSAFTLLEMLIVIALIGLLATVAIVNLGGIMKGAEEDIAKTFVTTNDSVLWLFKRDMGRFPSTEEGLKSLILSPEGGTGKWRGPYIKGKNVPEDPWKRPYQYRYPGAKNTGSYDLYSWGPDGQESADDIGNW